MVLRLIGFPHAQHAGLKNTRAAVRNTSYLRDCDAQDNIIVGLFLFPVWRYADSGHETPQQLWILLWFVTVTENHEYLQFTVGKTRHR